MKGVNGQYFCSEKPLFLQLSKLLFEKVTKRVILRGNFYTRSNVQLFLNVVHQVADIEFASTFWALYLLSSTFAWYSSIKCSSSCCDFKERSKNTNNMISRKKKKFKKKKLKPSSKFPWKWMQSCNHFRFHGKISILLHLKFVFWASSYQNQWPRWPHKIRKRSIEREKGLQTFLMYSVRILFLLCIAYLSVIKLVFGYKSSG